MQKVGVGGIGRLAALVLRNRNLVLLGVVDQAGARIQIPFAPGRDDFDVGLQGIGRQFKTYLVVALAGGAVGDGVGAGLVGDVDQALGDQGTGDGGAEQVDAFIEGIGAEHREHEIADELFLEIVDVDFLDAHELGFLAGGLELLALANVGGEGDDLAVLLDLQPAQDDGGVETAGVGQHDLLCFRHGSTPS